MRKITAYELQEILRKHELWLDLNGEGGERADLYKADLYGADLRSVNLIGANLREADLRSANLRGTNLSGADLHGADLIEADLCGAYLAEVNLKRANLQNADLSGANLSEADLREADLRSANLTEADLSGANLRGAILREAKDIPYIPLACPEEGSFIGFKKAYADLLGHEAVIVKLLILEDAKRSSGTGRKCRCSKAKVLDIQDILGNSVDVIACSKFNNAFKYKIGEVVEVKDFDEDRFNECAPGIHFFINRQDAVDY